MTNRDWKIMVYLSGDNDLGEEMISSITGLSRVLGKTDRLAVYVYYDSNIQGYPSILFDLAANSNGQITNLGYEVKTTARSVYKFVEWCMESDKPSADKHMLILSGHGDAFQGNNFLKDSGDNSSVSMVGLADVLRSFKTKFNGKNNIDIVGFDSCSMASVEIAHQLEPVADHMIASQGLIPSDGWNYGDLIDRMVGFYNRKKEVRSIDPSQMCRFVADEFRSMYFDRVEFAARSIDISYIDLKKFKGIGRSGVVATLNDLAGELVREITNAPNNRNIRNAILAAHFNCQTFLFDQCADVVDLATDLQTEFNAISNSEKHFDVIHKKCQNVIDAVNNCATSYSDGCEYQWSGGLSVYFPWSFMSYLMSRRNYMAFDFAYAKRLPPRRISDPGNVPKPSDWTTFLDGFLLLTIKPPKPGEDSVANAYDPNKKLSEGHITLIPLDAALPIEILATHKANDPRDKVNDPRDKVNDPRDKVNDPRDKVNDPYDRVNDPRDRLTAFKWENFRRVKNFPWSRLSWSPPDEMTRRNTTSAE